MGARAIKNVALSCQEMMLVFYSSLQEAKVEVSHPAGLDKRRSPAEEGKSG